MYLQLFNIIAPVLICAALGFWWQRSGRPFDTQMVTGIVTNIATPCLIVASLTRFQIDPATFGTMALAAVIVLAASMTVAAIALRIFGLPRHTFLPAMMFANTGNMGLPLCLFAFGDIGLALGIAVFTVHATCQFTIGQLISAGSFSASRVIKTPVIYAVALALVLMAFQTPLPVFVKNTVTLLGGVAIPLMLMALGVSLASLQLRDAVRSFLLGALRISMGMAIGIAVGEALGLTGAERGVVIITSSMPAAVFNYLFAQRYGRDAAAVAGIVLGSTVLAFLFLPLILVIALEPGFMPWN